MGVQSTIMQATNAPFRLRAAQPTPHWQRFVPAGGVSLGACLERCHLQPRQAWSERGCVIGEGSATSPRRPANYFFVAEPPLYLAVVQRSPMPTCAYQNAALNGEKQLARLAPPVLSLGQRQSTGVEQEGAKCAKPGSPFSSQPILKYA